MGCSVYGSAIIGLQVPWDLIYKGTKKVKAFKHNHPEDWQVDPKTGKKLWTEQDIFIDGWNEDDGRYDATLGGYHVACDDREEPEHVIVCLAWATTDDLMYSPDAVQVSLPSAGDIKKLKQAMTKLGVWDDDSFGLFAYGHASC